MRENNTPPRCVSRRPSIPKANVPPPRKQMVVILAVFLVVGLVVATLVPYFSAPHPGQKIKGSPPSHLSPTSTIPSSPTPPSPTGSVDAPMFGLDAQHTHFNPSEHLLSPSTITSLRPYWTAGIGTGIAQTFFPSSPAVANRVVYVGSGIVSSTP